MLKVVIDTNVLLVSISTRSRHHWLWQALLDEKFELFVTTDILSEYAEIIGREMGAEVADLALDLLTDLPNVHLIQKYYLWHLIEADPDDNKFVDCAIAASANYLVTEDRHFRILTNYPYFKVQVLNFEAFQSILSAQ